MNAPAKRRPKRRPRHIEQMEDYVRLVCSLVSLADWTVTVLDEEPDDDGLDSDIWASVACDEGVHASFRFNRRLFTEPPEKIRAVVAHECGHMMTHRLDLITAQIRAALEPPAAEAIAQAMADEEEHIVERIAQLVAPHLPLPPKFTPPRRRGAR